MNGYCELFIYKNCKILKGKNFKVDNIDDYLSTCEHLNQDREYVPIAIVGQWMKHQIKGKYIITFDQTILSNFSQKGRGQEFTSFEEDFNYNYLVAQNVDTYTGISPSQINTRKTTRVFYFIVGKRWMSESAIELELEMDVINTLIDNQFDPNDDKSYLELSPKTTIQREHKNRWTYADKSFSFDDYKPLIDRYSEGINVPLYKTDEQALVESVYLGSFYEINLVFYLIYRARQNPEEHPDTPVDVLLCADETIYAKGGTTGYSGSRDPKEELGYQNAWVVYGGDGNVGSKLTFTDRKGEQTIQLTASNQCVLIYKANIYYLEVYASGNPHIIEHYRPKTFYNFRNVYFENVFYVRKGNVNDVEYDEITISDIGNIPQDTSFAVLTSNVRIGTIDDIDRTDPKLLKILALPYRPIYTKWSKVVSSGNTYWGFDLPKEWGIEDLGTYKLMKRVSSNITKPFSSEFFEIRTSDDIFYDPLDKIRSQTIIEFGDTSVKRNIKYETKLLHSDYYLSKFVYDSFIYNFKYQDINVGSSTFKMNFMVSSTMNSKMMFEFNDTQFVGYDGEKGLIIDDQDYSNLVYIARNNELPVYNSAFINYIRTGYNYDVKTKNRQLRNDIISGVITTTGAIISAVAGGPVGVAGAVGLGVASATKFYNTISQTAQAEQNIAQKLKSTEMQGLSVIGSDDIDLMSAYADNNKAKNVRYEVSPKMKKCLYDLFYYCGYIANYQGIPNTKTRTWFNFVQAEPVYKYEQNFPQELLEELSKRFREGITYLHKVQITENNETTNKWDFEQEMENWETNLDLYPRFVSCDPPTSLKAYKEYVIKNDLLSISNIGRLTNSGKLTWRLRRKSDLEEVNKLYGLDTITIKGNASPKAMDVRIGSTIMKEITFTDYLLSDYYWTIEFSADTSGGYNQDIVYNSIIGYISFD